MTVTLPHTFGTATPQPPEMMSFLDDNFNALLNPLNGIIAGSTSVSPVINLVPVVNRQTGASYTVLSTDKGNLVTFTNAGAIAVTLPQSAGAFAAPWFFYAECLRSSTGSATITPTASTIDGLSSIVLQPGGGVMVIADAVGNYAALRYTTKGQLTPGTTNTMTWAANTTQSQAHGLSSTPTIFTYFIQNIVAEHNWNIGDNAPLSLQTNSGQIPFSFGADATNTYIITQSISAAPLLLDRMARTQFAITPANWSINLVPFVLA